MQAELRWRSGSRCRMNWEGIVVRPDIDNCQDCRSLLTAAEVTAQLTFQLSSLTPGRRPVKLATSAAEMQLPELLEID